MTERLKGLAQNIGFCPQGHRQWAEGVKTQSHVVGFRDVA